MTTFFRGTNYFERLIEQLPIQPTMLHNMTVAGSIVPTRLPDAHMHPLFYVGVYSAIGVLASLVGVASLWVVLSGGLHGGELCLDWVLYGS
jgi:hypothetical protein